MYILSALENANSGWLFSPRRILKILAISTDITAIFTALLEKNSYAITRIFKCAEYIAKTKKIIFIASIFFWINISFGSTLRNYSAEYNFYMLNNHLATIRHILQQEANGQYIFRVYSDPIHRMLPLKSMESSIFKLDKSHVTPLKHWQMDTQFNGTRKKELIFDWNHNIATSEYNKLPWEHKLNKDMQDNITHLVQLKLDLDTTPNKSSYSYEVIKAGKVKTYTFEVEGKETLSTPFGQIETILLSSYKPRSKRLTRFWFAPSKNFLLIKMQQEEDGSEVGRAVLKSVQYFE